MRNILLPIETGGGYENNIPLVGCFTDKKRLPFFYFSFVFLLYLLCDFCFGFCFIFFVFSVFLLWSKIQYNKSPLTGRKFRHEEDE